jgi:nucleoside phosphorylase
MAEQGRLGVITGLVPEARTLTAAMGQGAVWVELSAANPDRAAQAVDAMVAGGARALLSYGLAAGLDPRLGPGTVLLPETIIPHQGELDTPNRGGVRDQLQKIASFRREDLIDKPPDAPEIAEQFDADPTLRASLRDVLGKAEEGPLVGVDAPIVRMEQKLTLFARTQAVGADMESHVVARAALAAGIPFAALRVVGDPSNRTIPQCALAGIGEDGRVDGWAVANGLLWRPWECFDLLTLALDTAQAMRQLRRVARRAAPLLTSL